ncbi:lipoprotein insertase outer membrane protein LolB [Acidihalobacter ferrooxydans]|uniref:Outer-membrane lipoprotein LolB n=1 Tax=Acidihalobacter ferrooxydans TaxID=1765967 RepID=A0A1P8UGF6_9GAMM|nr:lipoprotein insertase outer membrane protein LolB [Acidihalobacter ferrooxydans]APZ42916.1 outer membrane lipoprotein LolB [Acidihalobacter ferrooxydans]
MSRTILYSSRRGYGAGALLALCLAMLGGCAVAPPHPATDGGAAWQRHQAWVRAHPNWSLNGRFALNVAGRGWSASLRWLEQGTSYRIDIFGPFGRTVAQLEGGAQGVSLRTQNEPLRTADSVSALMQSALGWSLPVTGLRYWVRGVPAPGTPISSQRIGGSGHLSELNQDGWTIRYLGYNYAFGTRALPTHLRLSNGNVKLNLLVDRWGAAQ